MKFFELIQITSAPTKSALTSGKLGGYLISDPTVMGYLRNNSIRGDVVINSGTPATADRLERGRS